MPPETQMHRLVFKVQGSPDYQTGLSERSVDPGTLWKLEKVCGRWDSKIFGRFPANIFIRQATRTYFAVQVFIESSQSRKVWNSVRWCLVLFRPGFIKFTTTGFMDLISPSELRKVKWSVYAKNRKSTCIRIDRPFQFYICPPTFKFLNRPLAYIQDLSLSYFYRPFSCFRTFFLSRIYDRSLSIFETV